MHLIRMLRVVSSVLCCIARLGSHSHARRWIASRWWGVAIH